MPRENLELVKLYYACDNALSAFGGLKFDTFTTVDEVHSTVCWHIVQISEIVKSLSSHDKATLSELPWDEMQAWGDTLIRTAPDVDLQGVWNIANGRIPEIRDKLMIRIYGEEHYNIELEHRKKSRWNV